MSTSILIADDHDIIRAGIKSILQNEPGYKVIGEATNGEEVLQRAEELKPDIILLDITMPKKSGLDVIAQLQHILPKVKTIIISMHRSNIYMDKAFKMGAKGYLNKDNVAEELIPALRRVARGEVYLNAKLSQNLVDRVTQQECDKSIEKLTLTSREKDVLRLVVEGKTAREIANDLFISRRTVENYKNALLKKLGLARTSDLIKYAIKHNIVEIE
ncbi:MAG: response regulator transcription factor [Candidatus Omnitrophota bacterium]